MLRNLNFSNRQPLKVWGGKVGDTGRVLEFQCIKDAVPIDLTGCTVKFNMTKPVIAYTDATITDAAAGMISIALTSSILCTPGVFPADISITDSATKIISSATFEMEVEESQRNEAAIEASNEFSSLQTALVRVQDIDANEAARQEGYTAMSGQISQLSETIVNQEAPRLSFNTLAARTGTTNEDTVAGSYYPMCTFYHVWDNTSKNTGAIYGVEEPYTGRTVQRILRSIDGGNSWTVLGSVNVNVSAGERISKIFVDPFTETIYLLRAVNISANPVMRIIESWNNTLTTKYGTLDIGTHDWHAASQNVDCYHNWSVGDIVMFAEYGDDSTNMRVWKTTNKGATWTNVFTQVTATDIRHFHVLQIDPYTNHWWLASGDTPAQCKIWKSSDDGVTWTLMGSGTEEYRCLGYVFDQNYVYWAMDATVSGYVNIFKAPKTDLSQRVKIGSQIENYPVYQITRTFYPLGFLIFPQYEPTLTFKDKISVQFYSIENQKLYTVAQFKIGDMVSTKYYGFTGDGSRYQDRINGTILAMLNPDLAAKYKYTGGSTSYTGALNGKLSM